MLNRSFDRSVLGLLAGAPSRGDPQRAPVDLWTAHAEPVVPWIAHAVLLGGAAGAQVLLGELLIGHVCVLVEGVCCFQQLRYCTGCAVSW